MDSEKSTAGRMKRKHLLVDLKHILGKAHVLTDPGSLLAYESDALTLFRSRPSAVILPKTEKQVIACAKRLHQAQIPWAARGAGTGLSGGALVPPGGVVMALTRMNRILEIDPVGMRAKVQPGVVNAALGRAVEPYGLRFAPDPASQTVSTLGGNLAENAGGPQCFLHGTTTNHVFALRVVLPDGTVEDWGTPSGVQDGFDLRGFFAGSEGTVGIAVSIDLRLIPQPDEVCTFLAGYDSVTKACEVVSTLVAKGLQPVALEVMDQNAIRAVEDSVFRAGLPVDAGAVLLVEIEGSKDSVQKEKEAARTILQSFHPSVFKQAATAEERTQLWKGRKGAGGALGRLAPDSYVMDGVVPRSQLAAIMTYVEEVQKETGLHVANLFHAGDGNIHPHFSYDARDAEQCATVEDAGARILRKCLELGGSITGEHGIGLEKENLLAEQYTSEEINLMERVRQIFNPDDLLNPGKGLPMKRGCSEVFRRHAISHG